MTAGAALMYAIDDNTPIANVYGYSILLAVGSGITFNAGYTIAAVKASLDGHSPTDIQNCVSFINFSQIGGQFVALVISGQVFQEYAFRNLKAVLGSEGYTEAQIRSAISGAQSGTFESLEGIVKEKTIAGITDAIGRVYIMSMVVGALALIGSLFMRKERLFGLNPSAGG